jgi:phenylpyruvate tautomerase PptA (4-oxalocrotonate tautomerase family)
MPHLTVYAVDEDLSGHESDLIAVLTDAVVSVYGEWARGVVVVLLVGVPRSRWGIGGRPAQDATAPIITFGIREAAFARADADELVSGVIRAVTDAVGAVLGTDAAAATQIELQGAPSGRTAVGGVLVD